MKKNPLNNVNYYERFRDMIEDLGERYGDRPAISWFTRKAEEKGAIKDGGRICALPQRDFLIY